MFFTLLFIISVGLAIIFWIMIREKRHLTTNSNLHPESTLSSMPKPTPETFLKNLDLEKNKGPEASGLHDKKQDESLIKENSQLSLKYDQILNDYKNLEQEQNKTNQLLTERAQEIEHYQKNLNHALKTQKEFNKIKDILEKELKDTRDKVRNIQAKLTESNTELENQRKRVVQLEDKVKATALEVINTQKSWDEAKAENQTSLKRIDELQTYIENLNKQITEKNQKIEDLVNILKEKSPPQEQSKPPSINQNEVKQEGGGIENPQPTQIESPPMEGS